MSRILVVDDDGALRTSIAKTLRKEGFDVLTADCGAQALALLERHSVQVALVDLRMPGMDGIALLEAIDARYELI